MEIPRNFRNGQSWGNKSRLFLVEITWTKWPTSEGLARFGRFFFNKLQPTPSPPKLFLSYQGMGSTTSIHRIQRHSGGGGGTVLGLDMGKCIVTLLLLEGLVAKKQVGINSEDPCNVVRYVDLLLDRNGVRWTMGVGRHIYIYTQDVLMAHGFQWISRER